jgi:hypothetical protein
VPTISIITATSGRPTLTRAIASLAPQLEHGDEMLIVRRDNTPWGNQARDDAIPRCAGTHLWWMDDDDMAATNALAIIRQAVAADPGTIHIFRMAYEDRPVIIWQEQRFECGWVGGPMCVVPNTPGLLGQWQHNHAYPGFKAGECGDWHFLSRTLELLGRPPVWHTNIIARIRVPDNRK